MCYRLDPATLAIIALNLQIPLANSFLNIVTYVIIITNVVTAIGAMLSSHQRKQKYSQPVDVTVAGS